VTVDLAVATPTFLDLTFVGLEALPRAGEERYAGALVRSPGGGAITAVAGARLGLRSALLAPLGEDLAGDFVRREVERDGVLVQGRRVRHTPETVVLPVGEECAMVTIDPGARTGPAEIAAVAPTAVATNLELLDIVPDGVDTYVTCGDDDARAFAGDPPAHLGRARALLIDRADALVLTGSADAGAAAAALGAMVETVVIAHGARPPIAMVDGRQVQVPEYDGHRAVGIIGDKDLLSAAYAWATIRGADPETAIAWAHLYSRLAQSNPTATGGAVTEARLLEAGRERGLIPPPAAAAA
jgi:ribokinase